MAEAIFIDALGTVLRVDVAGEDRDRLLRQWSRCIAPPTAQATPLTVPEAAPDADRRDYALASAVTLAGISGAAGSQLMLHAAGVADPDTGAVAVLVAASGTGKTTAAARLCATPGFGYVTDETVSVGRDLTITPYPKPLSVVLAAQDPHHKTQHSPDDLGLTRCPAEPSAARFVLLDRSPGQDRSPALEPLPLLDGLLALIPQTSALPALPDGLWRLADTVQRTGGVWRLSYRDIEDAAHLLHDALHQHPARPEQLTHLPPARHERVTQPYTAPSATAPNQPLPQMVRRSAYTDAIAVDDELLVLLGSSPVRLTGLGVTLWSTAGAPICATDLAAACVAAHGDHPQAAELVRAATGELLAHGVLEPATTT